MPLQTTAVSGAGAPGTATGREIHRNGWLRCLPYLQTSDQLPKSHLENLFVSFCIHDADGPWLEFYDNRHCSADHKPVARFSLNECLHVSPRLVSQQEDCFEFAVTLKDKVLRLATESQELTLDWVATLTEKLRERGVFRPKENEYSAEPHRSSGGTSDGTPCASLPNVVTNERPTSIRPAVTASAGNAAAAASRGRGLPVAGAAATGAATANLGFVSGEDASSAHVATSGGLLGPPVSHRHPRRNMPLPPPPTEEEEAPLQSNFAGDNVPLAPEVRTSLMTMVESSSRFLRQESVESDASSSSSSVGSGDHYEISTTPSFRIAPPALPAAAAAAVAVAPPPPAPLPPPAISTPRDPMSPLPAPPAPHAQQQLQQQQQQQQPIYEPIFPLADRRLDRLTRTESARVPPRARPILHDDRSCKRHSYTGMAGSDSVVRGGSGSGVIGSDRDEVVSHANLSKCTQQPTVEGVRPPSTDGRISAAIGRSRQANRRAENTPLERPPTGVNGNNNNSSNNISNNISSNNNVSNNNINSSSNNNNNGGGGNNDNNNNSIANRSSSNSKDNGNHKRSHSSQQMPLAHGLHTGSARPAMSAAERVTARDTLYAEPDIIMSQDGGGGGSGSSSSNSTSADRTGCVSGRASTTTGTTTGWPVFGFDSTPSCSGPVGNGRQSPTALLRTATTATTEETTAVVVVVPPGLGTQLPPDLPARSRHSIAEPRPLSPKPPRAVLRREATQDSIRRTMATSIGGVATTATSAITTKPAAQASGNEMRRDAAADNNNTTNLLLRQTTHHAGQERVQLRNSTVVPSPSLLDTTNVATHADAPQISESLYVEISETTNSGHSVPLREAQILKLQEEMAHQAGILVKCAKRDLQGSLALVDVGGAVYIAGWNKPQMRTHLHIGDRLLNICGRRVICASEAHKTIKSLVINQTVELTIQRIPYGKALAMRRGFDGENLGLIMENGTNEIHRVLEGGLAHRNGLPLMVPTVLDGGMSLTSWWATEVNHRPINLFYKNSEIEPRLRAVGKDISLVVQPSDFIRALKKQLKSMWTYKSYIVQ